MAQPSSALLLHCLLLLFLRHASSEYWQIPKLGLSTGVHETSESELELSPDFEIRFYTQTLDHFNYRPESYATFQQRYIINFKYWGGVKSSSPIIIYTGDEVSIMRIPSLAGFMTENAPQFKALLVYIEHRYYGASMPFNESFSNTSTLGYFSSSQALADYAELIIDLKRNLSAESSPVIVLGGSYGGMLASWFRLKYPHIAVGALASSAPILYFDDITPRSGYHLVVTNDYREASESCYSTIRDSWLEIDRVGAEPGGLNFLSQKFSTCRPLKTSAELKGSLGLVYVISAQYDAPPYYPVNKVCGAIDGFPVGSDILSKISAGYSVGLESIFGVRPCNAVLDNLPSKDSGWYWQTCTEMVFPIGYNENETMFQNNPFDLNEFTRRCQSTFNVTPRPHWITTQFGGHNITSVLRKFASNIIFSNGLRDPYSVGGVLHNISDSIVALYTTQGSHGLDLHPSNPSDPEWLILQRNKELEILEGWIREHNNGRRIYTSKP